MKTTLFCRATLLMLSLLFFLLGSFSQAYTRWALPAGANMRLGKGTIPGSYSPYLARHSIGRMQYSPDGQLLAVASSIGVWLYDTETYQERTLLTGHPSLVSSVCFSPDGRILASGSWDGTILLWDVATETLQQTLILETEAVTSVRFSPDGRTLASVSDGGEMGWSFVLWDVATGSRRGLFSPAGPFKIDNMEFSPDGQTLASSSGADHVRLWDVATGTPQQMFRAHSNLEYHNVRVNSVRFSPDGETLASASLVYTWQSNTKVYIYTIRLWDVGTGEPLKTLTVNTDSDSSLCWSPDGQTLAMGSLDSTIRLWDIASGEPVKMLIAHTDVVFSLCWSPDGQTLASASQDGTIRLWDVATGLPHHTFTGHPSRVSSLYWRVDGQTLVAGYEAGKVRLWDEGGKVKLWDVVTGLPRRTVFHERSEDGRILSLSADGQLLASASQDGTIQLWDVATGALRHMLPGHTSRISSICFSADGQMLASARSWNSPITIRLWDVATGTLLQTLKTPTGNIGFGTPYIMEFSPDGQTLASGGEDYMIRLWDVNTGTLRHTLTGHNGEISSLCFSPDGHTLASGNSFNPSAEVGRADYTIRLWDVATGELRKTLTGHTGQILGLGWSPNGQTLASSGGSSHGEAAVGVGTDYTVRVWDVATGELQRTFTGHTSEVLSVRFSADGQTLASGSADGTVLLWEMNPDAPPQKQ